MPQSSRNTVTISKFKATCLALLEEVRRTGRPLLVTRRGEPIAEVIPPPTPPHAAGWLGSAASTGRILGDIIEPAASRSEWEALRD
jgi:prevent-host-death family protein